MKVYDVDDPRVAHAVDRPRPEPDRVTAPFWAAAAQGKLVIQWCAQCDTHQYYPRPFCTRCAGDVDWVEVSGRGSVYTFTIIRQNLAPPFGQFGPYVVAMIELEQGQMMMSNVTDVDVETLRVGMDVECYAVRVTDDIGVPFFRPASR